jgi:hypothetical protein
MGIEEDRTGTWLAYGRTLPNQAESGSVGGSPRFSDYLAAHFPEVVSTIDQSDLGDLQIEVDALKLATREAILRNDWTTVSAHFAMIDSVLEFADTKLHDVIGTSYLISLFYNESSLNYAKARMLMPKRLANALEIIERHYEELAK